MSADATHRVIMLFADELRIAGKALARFHAINKNPNTSDDEYTAALRDAFNACSVALHHLDNGSDDAHVLVSSPPLLPRRKKISERVVTNPKVVVEQAIPNDDNYGHGAAQGGR